MDAADKVDPLEQVEREELDRAYRVIARMPEGKRVLFSLLEQFAIYTDAYQGEHTNATNYTLGLQSAGRRLIAALDAVDPRIYPQLLIARAEIKAIDKAAAAARAAKPENDDHED